MIKRKIIIFEICPNFPTFLCNCPDFFFRKLTQNPNKQNQKRITYSHRSNPELWSWVHTKKHFQFSPNYFKLVFPDFSPNLPVFFSIENIQLSYFHPGAYRTKKKNQSNIIIIIIIIIICIQMHTKIIIFAVCPNFSNFLCNCPDFFFLKIFSRL
jgi:hypothetical protein